MGTSSPSGRATEFKEEVRAIALREGFDVVRITDAQAAPRNREGLQAYLSAGHHGAMDWMETRADERADPGTLWAEARSVIVLGMNYGPEIDPLASGCTSTTSEVSPKISASPSC